MKSCENASGRAYIMCVLQAGGAAPPGLESCVVHGGRGRASVLCTVSAGAARQCLGRGGGCCVVNICCVADPWDANLCVGFSGQTRVCVGVARLAVFPTEFQFLTRFRGLYL